MIRTNDAPKRERKKPEKKRMTLGGEVRVYLFVVMLLALTHVWLFIILIPLGIYQLD